ncbi:MAG: DDE-type integrase/transposase/recombinase, partial [Cycloclasticus sp.]
MLIENWLTDELRPINQLTLAAQEYLATSKPAPSRMVGVNAFKNLCSFIPSKKMGTTVSTESYSAERAFALLCECDDNVIGYYDQPQPIMVKKTDKNGKLRSVSYTPDFLIETVNGAFVVEVKTLDQAVKLTEKEPSNWTKSNDNSFKYVSAKEAFSNIGLKHYVWVYSQNMAYFISNMHLIYFSRNDQPLSSSFTSKINGLFDQSIFWTMYEFKNALNLDSYTEIFRAIDKGFIKANLETSLLSNPKSVLLAKNSEMLEIAISQISRKGDNFTYSGVISSQYVPTQTEAKKALERKNRIDSGEKSRNVRRWNKRIELGKNNGLSEFESLIDKSSKKGNRKTRINKTVLDYLDNYLKNEHGSLQGISIYRSHIRYSVKSKVHHSHYDPVGLRTFTKHLNMIPSSYIAFQRGGRRLRNGLLEPTDPLKRNLKPQLPWQSAAIDEYLADIYLVFYTANGQRYEVRPWIAAMIDLATSKILALSLSFNNPSKRSLAKVIRECVRNHGKLPQEILFDRGSNYKSKYAAELLASLGVINTMRPAAYSRSGGEVE